MKAAFVNEKKGEGNPEGKSPGICKYFSEPMQDVEEEELADGSTKQNLERRGATSVVLPTTMPRIALGRRRISLELLVEMVARVMESVPIQSRRSRR